jgi:hypothetical protein
VRADRTSADRSDHMVTTCVRVGSNREAEKEKVDREIGEVRASELHEPADSLRACPRALLRC